MKVSVCTNRDIIIPCGLDNFEYQLDTYIGCEHNCNYCYVLPKAETNWFEEILIHDDIAEKLSKEIQTISPQTIYIGYNSDPYQPFEGKYLQTRKVLELLVHKNFSASILTKSDLVVRDIDLLKKMKNANVSFSLAFTDDRTLELFEANTISTDKRVAAMRNLSSYGIKTGAVICPVIPYITDTFKLVEMIAPYSENIWIYGLSINDRADQNWKNVKNVLSTNYPEISDTIESIIFNKEHHYWTQLRNDLKKIKRDQQLNLNVHL